MSPTEIFFIASRLRRTLELLNTEQQVKRETSKVKTDSNLTFHLSLLTDQKNSERTSE